MEQAPDHPGVLGQGFAGTADRSPGRVYSYGYQWWLGRSLLGKRELRWAAAMGRGGQHIFVVSELDLVVVLTAGLYDSAALAWIALDILNRHVLSAIKA